MWREGCGAMSVNINVVSCRLFMALQENNMSTSDLAKMLQEDDPLPASMIDRYLQGVSVPPAHIALFAKMLGYPTKWFHQPCVNKFIRLYTSKVDVVKPQHMRYDGGKRARSGAHSMKKDK